MKKYLLSNGGKFYKANLHCHSNISDGSLSPEEIKKIYTERGYSIIAYTDHDVFIPHDDLTDDNFLALHGYEMEVNGESLGLYRKTCHMCFVAIDPDNLTQVCYHREKYLFANSKNHRDEIKFDETLPDYERVYTPEKISEMMKIGRDNGFFVTYNHPTWSMEDYNDYANYHGMHAMEICNFGCVVMGYPDYNEKEYDEMLRNGERIYCIATDDNHNRHPVGTRDCDSFGGFTMIKADKLDYKTITDALVRGDFYASERPEIYDLWVEDGRIHITCSDADRIILNTGRRCARIKYPENGTYLNSADFEILDDYGYVRITVIDENGYHASTNAYFVDELLG